MNNRRKFFAALASLPAAFIPSQRKPEPRTMEVEIRLKPMEPEVMAGVILEAIRRNSHGIAEEIIKQVGRKNGGEISR